jgi:cyclophilin family peptidyl-prolyl cis-trans isomerase
VQAGAYDGSVLVGVTDGIGGDVAQGKPAAASFPAEKTVLGLDRAGVLGMVAAKGTVAGSRFLILEHGDLEYKGRLAPFGSCKEPTVSAVEAMSHDLLTAGNEPPTPVVLNKVLVLKPGALKAGEPLPPLTPNGPALTMTYPPVPGSEIPAPSPTGPIAVIDTTMGTMTCRLFTETPVATANFIGLATGAKAWKNPATHAMMKRPFYNGLHFERVIPDFMIEQGDLPGDHSGDGSIGFQFSNEIVPGLRFDRPGRLAYANSGPTTNASAFFITEDPQPRLNGNYTIFGQCDPASVKVAAAIARVPRDANNEPLKPVTVRRITIEAATANH